MTTKQRIQESIERIRTELKHGEDLELSEAAIELFEQELTKLAESVREEEGSRIEIELDKAYPKDCDVPKRDILFLIANGEAKKLNQKGE